VESGIARRRPRRAWSGLGALLAGVAGALVPLAQAQKATYVIGAKSFAEQYILSAVMAERLRQEGFSAARRVGLGSVIAFRALANGEIDAYVDYSGTIWANVMGRRDTPTREALLQEMQAWLQREHGVSVLGALGFENAYALAMRNDRARTLGIRTIEDLATHASQLSIGGDFEFFARPEWAALRERYGLSFRAQRQFQSTFMYQAVAGGEVDVISAFTSDGRIAAYDLLVLEDPRQVVLPYDAIVLLSPQRSGDPHLRRALQPLVGAISIELMREANQLVDRDRDKRSPTQAAAWLASRLGR
jgi:osmoprotectant transport system permease protein